MKDYWAVVGVLSVVGGAYIALNPYEEARTQLDDITGEAGSGTRTDDRDASDPRAGYLRKVRVQGVAIALIGLLVAVLALTT
ncbi:hypothetical protein [Halarchaeum sp. P4]|uniref:hypothetical protein n=1 Tax=Halarchaeum sp. P4 TaxID=3421639 RepID=UPI003EBE877E